MEQQVSIIVAEVVGIALFGTVQMGEVAEVEACHLEHLPPQGSLALRAVALQQETVVAQFVIGLLYQALTCILGAPAVAGCRPALVGTVYLACPAYQRLVAAFTSSFGLIHRLDNTLSARKRLKSLYTFISALIRTICA